MTSPRPLAHTRPYLSKEAGPVIDLVWLRSPGIGGNGIPSLIWTFFHGHPISELVVTGIVYFSSGSR